MDDTDSSKKIVEVAGSFPLIQLSRSSGSGARSRVSPTPPLYETKSTGKFSLTDEERIEKAIEIYEGKRNGALSCAKEKLAQIAFINKKTEYEYTYIIELKEVYTTQRGIEPSPEIYQLLSIGHSNPGYISDIHNYLTNIDPKSISFCHPLSENSLPIITINMTKLAANEKASLIWEQIEQCAPNIPKPIWSKLKLETGCGVSSSPPPRPRHAIA